MATSVTGQPGTEYTLYQSEPTGVWEILPGRAGVVVVAPALFLCPQAPSFREFPFPTIDNRYFEMTPP
jgi:hypothetical protein